MKDLERWMERAVQSGSWRNFDDFHVEGGAAPREAWVAYSMEQFDRARSIRDQRYRGFAVLLGFSFEGTHDQFRTTEDLAAILDFSPPSLYLFPFGSELLASALSDAAEIALPSFAPAACRAYLRESDEAGIPAGSLLFLDAG